MLFKGNKQGLYAWTDSTTDPFLLAWGSMLFDTNSNGLEFFWFDPFNTRDPFHSLALFESD